MRISDWSSDVCSSDLLGPQVWGKSADVIATIEKARAEGLEIWADQYPYTASGSSLMTSLVPGWAQEGGAAALAKRLQDPALRPKIRRQDRRRCGQEGGSTVRSGWWPTQYKYNKQ